MILLFAAPAWEVWGQLELEAGGGEMTGALLVAFQLSASRALLNVGIQNAHCRRTMLYIDVFSQSAEREITYSASEDSGGQLHGWVSFSFCKRWFLITFLLVMMIGIICLRWRGSQQPNYFLGANMVYTCCLEGITSLYKLSKNYWVFGLFKFFGSVRKRL